MRHQLKRTRPRDAVQGEEFETTGHGPRRWVIDPIDGTKNFVRGVPVWATLISLVDEGQPVLGLVAAPALEPSMVGRGRLRRLERAQPVQRQAHPREARWATVADASLSHSSISSWRKVGRYESSSPTWPTPAGAPARTATSGPTCCWPRAPWTSPPSRSSRCTTWRRSWPIVTEAGGRFTALDGTPGPWGGNAVATNGILHDEVLARIGTRSVDAAPEDD